MSENNSLISIRRSYSIQNKDVKIIQQIVEKLQSDLQSASQAIIKLTRDKAKLKAALAETLEKRNSLYSELKHQQTCPQKLKEKVKDLVRRQVKKSKECKDTKNMMKEYGMCWSSLYSQLQNGDVIECTFKILEFAEQLISQADLNSHAYRLSKLKKDVNDSINRSKELLASPKRNVKIVKSYEDFNDSLDSYDDTPSKDASPDRYRLTRKNTRVGLNKNRYKANVAIVATNKKKRLKQHSNRHNFR